MAEIHWITEENYAERMRAEAEPYVAARRETGSVERIAGQPIYYEHYTVPKPKAVLVVSHGFTESIRKFTESVYYMLQAGFEVWGVDHRGHGRSFRHNDNPYTVHVERFDDYVQDLVHLTRTLILPSSHGLPLYLYGHSMGGCVAARIIERFPTLFQKAVLTSPMLGLSFGKIPVPVMYVGASAMGIGSRRKNSLQPADGFPEEPDFENSCDSSECRYLYYYEKRLADRSLQTHAPSIQWGKEAVKACAKATSRLETARICIPVLLFQAGADTVVENSAQELFASRVPTCTLTRVPGMKHELYMTDSPVLIHYWEQIFLFLER